MTVTVKSVMRVRDGDGGLAVGKRRSFGLWLDGLVMEFVT